MSNLNKQCSQMNIVINKNDKYDTIESLANNLDLFLKLHDSECQFAYIIHDKDINDEGIKKTPHIHLLLWNMKRVRLVTILTRISSFLKLDVFNIQIEKLENLTGSIQYLIHKNDLFKTHYYDSDIKTSLTDIELNTFLNAENNALTSDRLIDMVDSGMTKRELLKVIGLSMYNHYYRVIQMLYDTRNL